MAHHVNSWIYEGEYRQNTQRTLGQKRDSADKLLWFLNHRKCDHCGVSELKQFFAYVGNGHTEMGGRWGNALMTNPVRPTTVRMYYRYLSSLFTYLVVDEVLPESPFRKIRAPLVRPDQVRPFSQEQLKALLVAARRSSHPKRNEAIVLLLLDTGLCVSELCALRRTHLDLDERRCTVLGKGNKKRIVHFARNSAKVLWKYLCEQPGDDASPVFSSDRGVCAGGALTRSGVLQMIECLGKTAHLQAVRCSPHTFRHTFAVEFLRGGGQVLTLKELLGHANLQQTMLYVALSQADLATQHRQFSPVDRLIRG